jgi:hypothetical protein
MILASRGFPFRGSEDVMSLPRPCLEGGTIALVAPGGKAKCQERRADTPSNQAGLPRRLIPGIWRGALLRWSLLLCPACTSVQPQGHGLASLAAAIFPTTVLKSLCDNDLLRPKIGFDLALSRHSGSSAEISLLHWSLPMNSLAIYCSLVHYCMPPPVHGPSGSRAPARRLPKIEQGPTLPTKPSLSYFSPTRRFRRTNRPIPRNSSLATRHPLSVDPAVDARSDRLACRLAIIRNAFALLASPKDNHLSVMCLFPSRKTTINQ